MRTVLGILAGAIASIIAFVFVVLLSHAVFGESDAKNACIVMGGALSAPFVAWVFDAVSDS